MANNAPVPDRVNADLRQISVGRALAAGLAMGTADAVPGVSGGTIALIIGIYERLIGALHAATSLVRPPYDRASWRAFRGSLPFLVPLFVGIAVALFVATKLLVGDVPRPEGGNGQQLAQQLLTTPPKGWLVRPDAAPIVFAFFFGLVVCSVNVPWKAKRETRGVDWLLLLVGAALAAGMSLATPAGGATTPLALLGAGVVGISVMLLPGVSGSLALLVLGMYQPISGAVHSREWGILAWFGLGLVLGVTFFVPVLRQLLARAHDRTMSFLTGLMAGSLVALWPWKAHYLPRFIEWLGPMEPGAPTGSWWWPALAAVAGGAVILSVARLARATD